MPLNLVNSLQKKLKNFFLEKFMSELQNELLRTKKFNVVLYIFETLKAIFPKSLRFFLNCIMLFSGFYKRLCPSLLPKSVVVRDPPRI